MLISLQFIVGFALLYSAGWLFYFTFRKQCDNYKTVVKENVICANVCCVISTVIGLILVGAPPTIFALITAPIILRIGIELLMYGYRMPMIHYTNIMCGDVIFANFFGGFCTFVGLCEVLHLLGI
jgi:hypothetical protein